MSPVSTETPSAVADGVAPEPAPQVPPPVAAPADVPTAETPPADPAPPRPQEAGGKRKPDQVFKICSDRTTVLEVAIWENEVRYDDRVSVQHSIVLSRSYKTAEGKWVASTCYRTHDLPLLRCLLDRAHAWCAERRTEDGSVPF